MRGKEGTPGTTARRCLAIHDLSGRKTPTPLTEPDFGLCSAAMQRLRGGRSTQRDEECNHFRCRAAFILAKLFAA